MSIRAFKWAKREILARAALSGEQPHQVLSSAESFVLLMIADHYNDEWKRSWPSQSTLARETGLSVKTVVRSVESLRARELLLSEEWIFNEGASRLSLRYCLPRFQANSVPVRNQPVIAFGSVPGSGENWLQVPGTNIFVDRAEYV